MEKQCFFLFPYVVKTSYMEIGTEANLMVNNSTSSGLFNEAVKYSSSVLSFAVGVLMWVFCC